MLDVRRQDKGVKVSRSPAAARRRLGMELRGLREAAGKRIDDAAAMLECSTAKISRLETGKGVPYLRDIRDLIDFYGEPAQSRSIQLMALAEEGRAQDWYSTFRDVMQGEMSADHLNRFYELERDADVVKTYQSDLIPGLLQTEAYIESICSIVFPEKSRRERARFVEFRLERQKLLTSKEPPELNLIVHEGAIVRRIGGPTVMRDQLEHLITQLDGPLKDIVDFRIVPLAAEARGALGGPFVILKYTRSGQWDQDLVYLEGREGATWLESDSDVTRYDQLFSGLERDSLSREDTLARLAQRAEQLTAED
jgi:transcriptional regulator with XRE-family HTH domain